MASPPALVWGAVFTLGLELPRAPVNTSSLLVEPDLDSWIKDQTKRDKRKRSSQLKWGKTVQRFQKMTLDDS